MSFPSERAPASTTRYGSAHPGADAIRSSIREASFHSCIASLPLPLCASGSEASHAALQWSHPVMSATAASEASSPQALKRARTLMLSRTSLMVSSPSMTPVRLGAGAFREKSMVGRRLYASWSERSGADSEWRSRSRC